MVLIVKMAQHSGTVAVDVEVDIASNRAEKHVERLAELAVEQQHWQEAHNAHQNYFALICERIVALIAVRHTVVEVKLHD